MIRALILDAGGVLVYPANGRWDIPHALRQFIGGLADEVPGPRWDAASAAAAHFLREDARIPDLQAEVEMRRLFLGSVNARLGWGLDANELRALAEDFTRNPARYGWYDDVQAMLQAWQGKYRLGMLSDTMPSFPVFLRLRGMEGYFEQIVISADLGVCKPDARMYHEICCRMNIAPEECLFVDDKPCNLAGAMAVGMAAVQMCRDGLQPWDGPFVRSLEELNLYLEELH